MALVSKLSKCYQMLAIASICYKKKGIVYSYPI